MDELVQVAESVMPSVSAVIAVYGHRVLERVRDEAADATADAAVGLGRRVLRRLLGGPRAGQIEEAVTDLAAEPDDRDAQAVLRAQIRKALADEAGLAAEVEGWVRAAGVSVVATGDRSAAVYTNTGIVNTGDHGHFQR